MNLEGLHCSILLPAAQGMIFVKKLIKKRVLLICCAVVLLCAALALWGNSHRSLLYYEETGLSPEAILRELPEIAWTEADTAIQEALLGLPEVRALEPGEEAAFSLDLAQAAVGEFLPEDAEISECGTYDGKVYLTYFQGEDRKTTLECSRDGQRPPQKVIARCGRDWKGDLTLKALYTNRDGGTITKGVMKRDWLYFLKG